MSDRPHPLEIIDFFLVSIIVGSFTKPCTCTLVNFTGETKNFLDCLLFVIFL